jgi:hypothetical protein
MKRTQLLAWVGLVTIGLAIPAPARAQETRVDLLLPGNEFDATEVPADAAGPWWVLHRAGNDIVLESLEVVVASVGVCGGEDPFTPRGRAVSVPAAPRAIALVRGLDLAPGPVLTAFRGPGAEDDVIEAHWNEESVTLRRVVVQPRGDQPGEYRIDFAVGDRRFRLHGETWHGDGHWRVRWIGDLNRDGWPDVLLDASYKYSVYTTRLFLSRAMDGGFEISQVAILGHSAC